MLLQVDNRQQKEPLITSEQAAKICDRNFGVGGDGVRVLSSRLSLLSAPLWNASSTSWASPCTISCPNDSSRITLTGTGSAPG